MPVLKRLVNGIDALSKWTGRVVSYLIPVMMLILVYEVVLRYIFNEPTRWAHELTLYMFGSYFMLLGGYALYSRAHITMDLLYNRWSPRTKATADVFTYLFFFFFIGFLLWLSGDWALAAVLRLEHSRSAWGPPVWPFKLILPLSAFLLLLAGVSKFIRDLTMAIRGKEL